MRLLISTDNQLDHLLENYKKDCQEISKKRLSKVYLNTLKYSH